MADPVRVEDIDALPTMDPKRRDETIRAGHLMFGSGRYWISKWIQFFTRSPWSHVALLFKDAATGAVMVLELAEGFGLETVAECVENNLEAQHLAKRGVNLLQGNLFGLPSIERPWLAPLGLDELSTKPARPSFAVIPGKN